MPCLLSEENNNNHVNIYYDLSQRSERDHEFLVKLITDGEKCVYGYDQETKQQISQSNSPSSPWPKMARQVYSNVNEHVWFTNIHLRCAIWICSKRTNPKHVFAHWHLVVLTPCGDSRKIWIQNNLKSTIHDVSCWTTTLHLFAPLWQDRSLLLKIKYQSSHILFICQISCQVTSFCY
jgi:hypothetical protein